MITKQQDNVNKALGWSELTSNPILIHVEEYDETLVAWNGLLMNKTLAMSLALEHYRKYATPKMKECIFVRYKQLYQTGFFGKQNWDAFFVKSDAGYAHQFYSYMRKTSFRHVSKECKKTKISEVLGWFNT